MIKVRDGTRSDGPLVCCRCTHATVFKTAAESQTEVHCGRIDRFIPIKVVGCSDFKDKNAPALRDMREQAWVVNTSRSGRQIGFLSPREARDRMGDYEIPGEWD